MNNNYKQRIEFKNTIQDKSKRNEHIYKINTHKLSNRQKICGQIKELKPSGEINQY